MAAARRYVSLSVCVCVCVCGGYVSLSVCVCVCVCGGGGGGGGGGGHVSLSVCVGGVRLSFCVCVCDTLSLYRLRQEDPPIPLGRVGVPDQMELAKRFGIGGYPLLVLFRNGKQYEYTGRKEEEGEH